MIMSSGLSSPSGQDTEFKTMISPRTRLCFRAMGSLGTRPWLSGHGLLQDSWLQCSDLPQEKGLLYTCEFPWKGPWFRAAGTLRAGAGLQDQKAIVWISELPGDCLFSQDRHQALGTANSPGMP